MTKKKQAYEALDRETILLDLGREELFLVVEDTVDSTSDAAKRHILSGGRTPAVFLAERQTAGRGRMGRSFYSPAETGLYLSLAVPAKGELADAVFLTTAAAVATLTAIQRVTGIETRIKWVNDLYYADKKVCGILAESFLLGDARFLILGVGINLTTEQFPEELRDRAGSLLSSAHGVRNRLAAAVIEELMTVMAGEFDRAELMATYRAHSMVLGREITYTENGVTYAGVAREIDEFGHLVIEKADGEIAILASGEITLRLGH